MMAVLMLFGSGFLFAICVLWSGLFSLSVGFEVQCLAFELLLLAWSCQLFEKRLPAGLQSG